MTKGEAVNKRLNSGGNVPCVMLPFILMDTPNIYYHKKGILVSSSDVKWDALLEWLLG